MRQGCPRRRAGVACDERTTDAVGNPCSSLKLPSGSPAARRSRTHRACFRPERCAGDASCTNRQHNAHVTESRVVLYRWHPWHGLSVVIVGAVGTGQHARYRCVLEHADDSRSFEVPQWMFDAAVCCRIALSPSPAVTYEVLRELRRLIDSACRPEVEAVLQAGHLAIPDPGGACATRESSAFGRSAGSVSPASIDSAVAGLAAGDTDAGAVVASAPAPKSSSRSSRRAARSGDVR